MAPYNTDTDSMRATSYQGHRRKEVLVTCAPPVDFCEVDPMQTESLTCKIACICLAYTFRVPIFTAFWHWGARIL